MRNLLTDVPGVLAGHAEDARAATGVTAAVSTGLAGPAGGPPLLAEPGTVAADCLARAVARGVYAATALPFAGAVTDWKTRFGGVRR